MKKLIYAFALFLICGCQSDNPEVDPNPVEPKPRVDIQLSASEVDMKKGTSQFAFNLFQQVNKTKKSANFLISPFSASLALAMT